MYPRNITEKIVDLQALGFSASIKVEAIKDYSQDGYGPALLVAGNQSYKVDIDSMWLGDAVMDQVLAGTPVDKVERSDWRHDNLHRCGFD